MDEHAAEIEHVIQHYLHRDLFRIQARGYYSRLYQQPPIREIGSVSHYKYDHANLSDLSVVEYVVENTRAALKRAKRITIHYLHDLLHEEPLLSEHEHIHNDGIIFTYVIQEALEIDFLSHMVQGE